MGRSGANADLLPKGRYEPPPGGTLEPVPLLFSDWPGFVPCGDKDRTTFGIMPEYLTKFAKTACDRAHLAIEVEGPKKGCPVPWRGLRDADPSAAFAIGYPHGGSFKRHVDGSKGWVISVSLGCSAVFRYGLFQDRCTNTEILRSGDVAVFNGGEVYHGISNVSSGTAPPFWTDPQEEVSRYDFARIVLQFRDRKDHVDYYPLFKAW
jgi:hypothetical protein